MNKCGSDDVARPEPKESIFTDNASTVQKDKFLDIHRNITVECKKHKQGKPETVKVEMRCTKLDAFKSI